MKFIQNIECGNIFDATAEGMKEAEELYDVGDQTNGVSFWEYYKIVEA